MNAYKELGLKIKQRKAKICVIGLGYVGLPLAVSFAKKGYFVYGLDNNTSRIRKLKESQQYIIDVDPKDVSKLIKSGIFLPLTKKEIIRESDIVIICVPTPLRKVKMPDISYVVKASKTIASYLRRGQMIILESTSFPTTTRGVVLPLLKKTGLKEERDFFLCFSPERVNPGDRKFPLSKISKVVGGLSPKSGKLAKQLYSKRIFL